jgi:hypothetical protein
MLPLLPLLLARRAGIARWHSRRCRGGRRRLLLPRRMPSAPCRLSSSGGQLSSNALLLCLLRCLGNGSRLLLS